MVRTKIVVALIALVLMVVLGLQNTQSVEATLLFFTVSVPLTALLLVSLAVGVVVGLLLALALGGRRAVEG